MSTTPPSPAPQSLSAWRLAHDWSQEKLATLTGLSRITIQNVEAGRNVPSVETAITISRALGVSVEQVAWPSNADAITRQAKERRKQRRQPAGS